MGKDYVFLVPIAPNHRHDDRVCFSTISSKALLFKKELQEYYSLRNSRIGRLTNHKWYITYWNHLNYACEKNYFDLPKN